MRFHCLCGRVSLSGITALQTSSSDLQQRGQRSNPSCCPQNVQRPDQPSLTPIKPLRAAPGGLSTHTNGLCQAVPHEPTPSPGWGNLSKQQPWHPKSCNCLWHSHILGQNPTPSVELLAAQGPSGPSVPQLQGICRKSGSNLSLAQTWQEATATNELNDWINVPLSSRQMCRAQLSSDN